MQHQRHYIMYENLWKCFRISKRNRTIIFSIHQPRYAIYKLFDNLLLLAKGNIVYQGPSADALGYFQDLGGFDAHNVDVMI